MILSMKQLYYIILSNCNPSSKEKAEYPIQNKIIQNKTEVKQNKIINIKLYTMHKNINLIRLYIDIIAGYNYNATCRNETKQK